MVQLIYSSAAYACRSLRMHLKRSAEQGNAVTEHDVRGEAGILLYHSGSYPMQAD